MHDYLRASGAEIEAARAHLRGEMGRADPSDGLVAAQVALSRKIRGPREWYARSFELGRSPHSPAPTVAERVPGVEVLACPACGSRCTVTRLGALSAGFSLDCQPGAP